MKKLSKWLFELDMTKSMKYIFWFFIIGAIYSIYSVYADYQKGDWPMISNAMNIGLFTVSALYYSVIIYWMNENTRRATQITNLIIENHELKQEIMIMKIPSLAKAIDDDSLN